MVHSFWPQSLVHKPTRLKWSFLNDYVRVEEDIPLRVVRFTRNDVPYPDRCAVERSLDEICSELERFGRRRYALLVDLRATRTEEPSLFADVSPTRQRLFAGFERVAVLSKASNGPSSLERLAVEDRHGARVFESESDALAYLRFKPLGR